MVDMSNGGCYAVVEDIRSNERPYTVQYFMTLGCPPWAVFYKLLHSLTVIVSVGYTYRPNLNSGKEEAD